jgi:hypothetical protein
MRQPAVHEHSQQLGHAPLDFDPRASAKKIGFVKSKKNLWGESRKPVSLKCPKIEHFYSQNARAWRAGGAGAGAGGRDGGQQRAGGVTFSV